MCRESHWECSGHVITSIWEHFYFEESLVQHQLSSLKKEQFLINCIHYEEGKLYCIQLMLVKIQHFFYYRVQLNNYSNVFSSLYRANFSLVEIPIRVNTPKRLKTVQKIELLVQSNAWILFPVITYCNNWRVDYWIKKINNMWTIWLNWRGTGPTNSFM